MQAGKPTENHQLHTTGECGKQQKLYNLCRVYVYVCLRMLYDAYCRSTWTCMCTEKLSGTSEVNAAGLFFLFIALGQQHVVQKEVFLSHNCVFRVYYLSLVAFALYWHSCRISLYNLHIVSYSRYFRYV